MSERSDLQLAQLVANECSRVESKFAAYKIIIPYSLLIMVTLVGLNWIWERESPEWLKKLSSGITFFLIIIVGVLLIQSVLVSGSQW
jgi:hypothetical protein